MDDPQPPAVLAPGTVCIFQKRPIDDPLPVTIVRYYTDHDIYSVVQRNGRRRMVSRRYLKPKYVDIPT